MHGNSPELGWVVQKFGGTSVGKFPEKIARDIVNLLGVYEKLKAVNMAGVTEDDQAALVESANGLMLDICNDHIFASEAYVTDERIRTQLIGDIKKECQEVIEYIAAAKRFNLEINARSKDRVISFGEKLSCLFMTALLRTHGVEAKYVDLSEVFHNDSSHVLGSEFYRLAAAVFAKKIAACETCVPVVTGFFGNVPGSLMEGDIGRGYTDLCAALCAVGVRARELQIWKEVDGIFTADPTKVPTASLLSSITPSEAAELTFYGSEVIHHLTMDQVIHAQPPIPIRIKNVNNPRGNGTLVMPKDADGTGVGAPPLPRAPAKPKRPTAVTIKDHMSIINIHSNKRSISHGFFARVFSILDKHAVSVDLISTSEVHVSLAIHSSSQQLSNISAAQKELEEVGEVSIQSNMAILSLVGAEMRQMKGIAGRMFSTLGEHQVNLEMISQGASEINISCVIAAEDATRAMNVLHTHLFTFLD
ncbi:aspartate kinase [Geosmithia morbida]|uniref:Aspartokinase n=1 Tax=Geosmithia morbida TaxID=1094350 RepID=A0A9P4YQI9_9HYPO|nr:aspartate kinase [Geosmithia morbida]KAF4120190.1 aspartate kinase [Geosmithia morbida]